MRAERGADEPRRVAVLTSSYPADAGDPSGNFVAAEVDALLRAGAAVTVIGPAPLGVALPQGARAVPLPHAGLFGWPGALERLRERPARARALPGFLAGAARALARLDPHEVHAHWLFPAGLVALVAAPRGAALTLVGHGTDLRLLARAPAALGAALFAALLARDARVRVVSPAQRDALLAQAPPALRARLAARTVVRPAALALGGRAAAEQGGRGRRARARAALGLADHAPLVLVVGRLVPGKRVDVALRAAREAGLPPAALTVLGDGPLRGALGAAFPGVRFRGLAPHDEALTWMAAADLLVSASLAEGAPTAVREALALGVPVLARRWDGLGAAAGGAPPAAGAARLTLVDSDAALAAALGPAPPPA